MSFLICKMCGGDLEILENSAIAECVHCRRKQTIPSQADENLQNLFNRANTLRMKGEFDKAEQIYESLIRTDGTQAEAYWGLILCKYGIEYVDDPATGKKIPTCHRASYDSIIADDDYKSALENANFGQKWLYEEQAKEIDRIQKEILALAQKEETYDIFICYKETDENGMKTQDSVYANDIYYQLKQNGYKVFYSAITLEGKLGREYEPIIFAALNSAKVMLVIGTKNEYFKAVWVKNEWSRFLKIIKKDRSKLLIPCYRDMDAYDLPDEFLHLQAQDMSKIGFINDLIRGIEKVVRKETPKVTAQRSSAFSVNIAPLLKRVSMFLEDEDWESADEYCEKVLDQDPENAEAYLGKLMAELKVKRQSELRNCSLPFDNNLNYRKVIRFGDERLKSTLEDYIEIINNRRYDPTYSQGVSTMKNATSIEDYEKAINLFSRVLEWKDSIHLVNKCKESIEKIKEQSEIDRKDRILKQAMQEMKAETVVKYETAIGLLQKIRGWKNADELITSCQQNIKKLEDKANADRKDAILNEAIGKMKYNTVDQLQRAIVLFNRVSGWKNANKLIEECEKKIKELEEKAENERKDKLLEEAKKKMNVVSLENYKKAFEILNSISGWANADELAKECRGVIAELKLKLEEERKDKLLNEAKSLMNSASISASQRAIEILKGIRDWKNANKLIDQCERDIEELEIKAENERKDAVLDNAKKQMNVLYLPDLERVMDDLCSIADWKDASEQIEICKAKIAECKKAEEKKVAQIIRKAKADKAKRMLKKVMPFLIIAIVLAIIIALVPAFIEKIEKDVIKSYMAAGDYGKVVERQQLTEFTIPDGVTRIDNSEFFNCDTLETVIIPDSVTTIGESAFSECTNLKNVTIPNSVTTIGSSAFENCISLENIIIPDSVTTIGASAFCDCENLKNVTISNNVIDIGGEAFLNCRIETATVSSKALEYIPRKALKEVTITNGSTYVGGLSSCFNLTSVTIPDSVTSIDDYAFSECTSLKSVTIPRGVTSIGAYAFNGCTILASATIPYGVIDIDNYAFLNCTGLTSVTIPDSVTSIGSSAFKGCTELTSITIPDSVTSIGDWAFSSCENLTSITIPNSVTSIGDYAFSRCSNLTSITIPNGVTSIGSSVFWECYRLTSITIPNSVTSIGNYAFSYCSNLTSITIPNSVTSIGNYAFYKCSNLISITIPNSVTSISEEAFEGCYKLTTINYCSTEEQWKKITKGANWDYLTPETLKINYNYTGE